MSGELVDKGIDEEERDDAPKGRRRTLTWVAAGVAVAALAGGALLVAKPWSNDDRDGGTAKPTASTMPRPPSDPSAVPTLSSHLMLDEVPEGYIVQWVNDAPNDVVDDGAPMSANVLLSAKGATVDDGPWLSATVVLLDRFERKSFDPDAYVTSADGVAVTIGSLKGSYVAKDFSDNSQLVFGPVKEGYVVTLSSKGLTRADLTSIAAELDLDESSQDEVAWPLFGATVDTLGLVTLTSYTQESNMFGGGPVGIVFGGFGGNTTDVSYSSDTASLTVSNSVAPEGLDVLTLAHFGLSKAKDVTVHDLPAVTGELPGGFGMSAVMWLEGGRLVVVVGSGTDTLLAMAESVRPADDSEWSDLNDQVQEIDGNFGQPSQTWLIASGDLEDATTWAIEGSVDEDGRFTLCSSSFTSDSSSASGCSAGEKVDGPAVLDAGSLGTDGPLAEGYVAVAPNDTEGAVLRFTADDGAVTEVPLKVVRDDWPFQAAAIAITSDGEITIVAADGTVLASQTVSVPGSGPFTSDSTFFGS